MPATSDLPPLIDMGGTGPRLHFSHANGYPPGVYQPLLNGLAKDFTVTANQHRPLWAKSFAEMPGWHVLGDDLVTLLAQQERPVLGVGHSMGAAALVMAALQEPQRFSGLVLVEPVMVSAMSAQLMRWLRPLAKRRLPLVNRTLLRVDRWPSQQAAFDHFRPKPVFARISDTGLWHYVRAGTRQNAQGEFELVFDKYWEAHGYLRIHSIWQMLPRLALPVLAIRGEHSNTVSDKAWQRWQTLLPEHSFAEVSDSGHLLPLERPTRVSELISRWRADQFVAMTDGEN